LRLVRRYVYCGSGCADPASKEPLMGYAPGALQALVALVEEHVPVGGQILDIGSQDISAATVSDLQPVMSKLHGDRAEALIGQRFRQGQTWKVADLFDGSSYRHQSVDLYPGKSIITADLNTFSVQGEHRGAFHLVANLGSTEHIFDQTNVFRCIHDFARVGGVFWHCVPFGGYYNHGLYNYHPLFFIFLARANKYEIRSAALSAPHLEHTIPKSSSLHGTEHWAGIRQSSGIVVFVMRKTVDAPFQLFTDYDQAVMGGQQQEDAWTTMMKTRYDLCVHE
jgi:hypothetical protein